MSENGQFARVRANVILHRQNSESSPGERKLKIYVRQDFVSDVSLGFERMDQLDYRRFHLNGIRTMASKIIPLTEVTVLPRWGWNARTRMICTKDLKGSPVNGAVAFIDPAIGGQTSLVAIFGIRPNGDAWIHASEIQLPDLMSYYMLFELSGNEISTSTVELGSESTSRKTWTTSIVTTTVSGQSLYMIQIGRDKKRNA